MHAADCSSRIGLSGGTACEQAGIARGHRVARGHPGGRLIALGISPRKMKSPLEAVGSATSTDPSRARVYGCRGLLKTCSVGPISAIRPRYITAMRSLIDCTVRRSCDMNRYDTL